MCGVTRVLRARTHCFRCGFKREGSGSGFIATVVKHANEGRNQFSPNRQSGATRGTVNGWEGLRGTKARDVLLLDVHCDPRGVTRT